MTAHACFVEWAPTVKAAVHGFAAVALLWSFYFMMGWGDRREKE